MRAEVWVGPERRRRWTVEEKVALVREAFAPGARVAEVARRRDVSRAQIYQWRAALRDGRLGAVGGEIVDFVPVAVTDEATVPVEGPAAEPVEIDLVGGRRLKVASSLPTAELRRLIRAVEGA
jgi:transposase